MKERIINYRKSIDAIIDSKDESLDYAQIINEHLVQISFFQHERLIHLIVTVLFASMCVILLCVNCFIQNLFILILQALIIILLIPYVFHYYTLENETQKMYAQYDELINIKNKGEGHD